MDGQHKHCYWHWLQCQLPAGKVSLTATLKLTHPDVIPRRDRIAAPMRLASWIRFETAMTSEDWEGAISLLVSNLHRPDQELLVPPQSCVAGQPIASMEEAQALLLKNFRVGKGTQSARAQWLTEMARDPLAPIPFREVFVIFLPQLTFVDEATTRQELWSSPTVRKFGLVVDVTPTATGLQGMREYRMAFLRGRKQLSFARRTSKVAISNNSPASLKYSAYGLAGWEGLSNRSGGARRMLLSLGALAGFCVSLSKTKRGRIAK